MSPRDEKPLDELFPVTRDAATGVIIPNEKNVRRLAARAVETAILRDETIMAHINEMPPVMLLKIAIAAQLTARVAVRDAFNISEEDV